jgi:hypothetical protein
MSLVGVPRSLLPRPALAPLLRGEGVGGLRPPCLIEERRCEASATVRGCLRGHRTRGWSPSPEILARLGKEDAGYFWGRKLNIPFDARIDVNGVIGQIGIERQFPCSLAVEKAACGDGVSGCKDGPAGAPRGGPRDVIVLSSRERAQPSKWCSSAHQAENSAASRRCCSIVRYLEHVCGIRLQSSCLSV